MLMISPEAATQLSTLLADKPDQVGVRIYIKGFG